MKTLHVSTSPLTNRIFCGSVSKDGRTWLANKTDVTGEACAAVAHHAISNGGAVTVMANGKPAFEITAKPIDSGINP